MIRVSGVILPPNKHIVIALRSIYGIGATRAKKICEEAGINLSTKVKDLQDAMVNAIQKAIGKYEHEGDLRRGVALNIKRLKEIKCYRGLRHRMNLPCRGQRTKTNARTRKGPRKQSGVKK